MDETPEYIKMCEMAKEIQEQWNLDDDTNYVGHIIDDYAMTDVYMGHFINSSLKILKANNQGKDYVWLPRQDQLQELIYPHINNSEFKHTNILEDFDKFLQSDKIEWPIKSLEQAWLALYVWLVHMKVWNGEGWVVT